MDVTVLLTDERGVVREINEVGRRLIGSAEGRPCHQLFHRRDHPTRCSEACAASLIAGETETVSQQVGVRAGTVHLVCHGVQRAIMVVAYGPNPTDAALTPREVEVLGLVADGLTGPQIAERTGLSRSTVNTHVEHAREKLGTRTRTEAVAVAVRRGFSDRAESAGVT